MSRFFSRFFLLIFPAAFAAGAWAQSQPASHVESASSRTGSHTSPVAPSSQRLFGAIPLSTKSEESRKSLELAWDRYENAMYDASADQARHASEKDPHSAIAYALISFAARRTHPTPPRLPRQNHCSLTPLRMNSSWSVG